jgi:FkbM family methyltransferase
MPKLLQTEKDPCLVFDVGLHHGQDTDFYLKKGFRVVAFEADPSNAAFCRERFADAIASGRLTIIEGAITEDATRLGIETVKFFRNEDHSLWGSTNEDWAARNKVLGTTNETIAVAAVDFEKCLEEYGVPHYLKADIVGSETICLRALLKFENKPDYISIRSEKLVFGKLEYEFDLLEQLGYDRFKAVKQDFEKVRSDLGGELYEWEEGASGPFGKETTGSWKSRGDTVRDYKNIFVKYWLFGDYSYLIQTERGRRFITRLERVTRRSIPGWYDTHAVHSSLREQPAAKPATASLKEQSAWLLMAKIIGFAFSFMLPLVIVRYLTQDAVGHYREAFQVIMNATTILPMGVSMSAYYFLARETPERRGAAVFNILIFNFIVGGLACLVLNFYPQLLGSLFQADEMTALSPKIGAIIWIWIFSTFLETIAIANQEARVATAFIVVSSFSKTLLMGAAVFAFGTVEAFMYAAMIQGVLQTFILLNYIRSRFPGFWRGFSVGFFREQLVYAVPFGIAAIVWIAQNDIHNYFVGYKFSSADFAIYAYGCFEIPLLTMLAESVTSVLIPRMNALQQAGDRDEMIRLTARAMQKLAFFYFPIYVFLMITSKVFIITLFTQKYEASASVFVINLTLLPLSVLITDPIVRSYKELGRMFLLTRILVLAGLVSVLYYGLGYFGLQGMITAAVGAIIIEKCITETLVFRKLGMGIKDLPLLKNVVKTAFASLIAGAITYIAYANVHEYLLEAGEQFAEAAFSTTKLATLDFVGGGLVLLVSACVFAPVYLIAANLLGLIEPGEKDSVMKIVRKVTPRRFVEPAIQTR